MDETFRSFTYAEIGEFIRLYKQTKQAIKNMDCLLAGDAYPFDQDTESIKKLRQSNLDFLEALKGLELPSHWLEEIKTIYGPSKEVE